MSLYRAVALLIFAALSLCRSLIYRSFVMSLFRILSLFRYVALSLCRCFEWIPGWLLYYSAYLLVILLDCLLEGLDPSKEVSLLARPFCVSTRPKSFEAAVVPL